jgi:hypothetical protein
MGSMIGSGIFIVSAAEMEQCLTRTIPQRTVNETE